MTKTKFVLPWTDASIRKLLKRKERLQLRVRKSGSPDVKNHYKKFRAHLQKVIRGVKAKPKLNRKRTNIDN